MKATRLIFLIAVAIGTSAPLTRAQVIIELKPGGSEAAQSNDNQGDDEIVREVFAPITNDLRLTPNQKLRIVRIAKATMLQAEPLFEQLDDLEAQLSLAAFTGRLDEAGIKDLAESQSALLHQIIAMKARAQVKFYELLTAGQRAIVVEQFRQRTSESLGSISN
jgi:Spy/CpxP family protein refolding chaperone